MNTVTAVPPQLLLFKDRQKPGHLFQVYTIFAPSSSANLNVQTSGWTEHFMQVPRYYMILDKFQIPLNFLLRVSFDILKFFKRNKHKKIFSLVKECEAASTISMLFVYIHICRDFTHEMDKCIHFMHILLICVGRLS